MNVNQQNSDMRNLEVPESFQRGITALASFSELMGGHDSLIVFERLRAQGAQGRELADSICRFSNIADRLNSLAGDLSAVAGCQENLARIASLFEKYLGPLKDPAQPNYKISTVQTGAGAGLSHILKYPAGSSRYLIDSRLPYHSGVSQKIVHGKGFEEGAVTEYAAMSLANASFYSLMENILNRPTEVGPQQVSADQNPYLISLGLTAATATARERRGQDHVWVAVRTLDGTFTAHVDLGKGQGQAERNRQDAACNVLGINALLAVAGLPQLPMLDPLLTSEQLVPNPHGPGQVLCLKHVGIDPRVFEGPGPFFFKPNGEYVSDPQVVAELLSKDFILFPGSSETLHFGHQEAARLAHERDCHDQLAANGGNAASVVPREVLFEICADNFDPSKGHVSNEELSRRVAQHAGSDWVVVTRQVPLMVQKLKVFNQTKRIITGYDTAKRFIAPSSYALGDTQRDAILEEFREKGIKMYVMGRDEGGEFKTVRNLDIPEQYRGLFVELEGRHQISSTALRDLKRRLSVEDSRA